MMAAGSLLALAGAAQAGTVLISNAGTARPGSGDINTLYNTNGHTSSVTGSAVTGAALAGVDLLISWERGTAFSAAEISAMSTFLTGGGRIAFFGENDNFNTENNIINSALSGLGSSMFVGIVPYDIFDSGFRVASGAQITGHFLNAGVSQFQYAAPNDLNNVGGGDAIFLSQDTPTRTWAAFDGLAGDGIVVNTDSNIVNFAQYDNSRWFLNLVDARATPVVPLPPAAFMGLGLLGAVGLVRRMRRRRA